jgi:predicted HTH transcriptional regulator
MMTVKWDQKALQNYIDTQIEENLTLDYKAADSLDASPKKKDEVTKDVSAMANSAGGTIIYGIKSMSKRIKDTYRKSSPLSIEHSSRKNGWNRLSIIFNLESME